ncbi:MAG: hypothetical protein ACI9LV_000082 [Candidatus Nanohaloarchaea archaeon]|jgi:hypothetical protein
MIENKNILAVLSLVVIASGCAHTASTSTNQATSSSVSINNFSAFPTDVYNNQNVRLELTLQNNGEATAQNVEARLFNVPFSGDSSWDLNDGRTVSFGTLEPADPEANLPARETTEFWSLEAPSLEDGVTIPYQFMTEIFYNYETQGTTSITLMDQQRFREQGNPTRPTLDTTSGPVQMEVRTRSPIVFYPGDGNDRKSEMCVIVRNEGQGTPFWSEDAQEGNYEEIGEDQRNKVRLRVQDQGRISFTNSDTGDNSNTAIVNIFGNRGIGCFDIRVDGWSQGVGPQEEVPIVMTLDYGYSKETSTSVTVTGSDRFGEASSTDTESTDDSSGSTNYEFSDSTPDSVREDYNADDYCPRAEEESPENYDEFCVVE